MLGAFWLAWPLLYHEFGSQSLTEFVPMHRLSRHLVVYAPGAMFLAAVSAAVVARSVGSWRSGTWRRAAAAVAAVVLLAHLGFSWQGIQLERPREYHQIKRTYVRIREHLPARRQRSSGIRRSVLLRLLAESPRYGAGAPLAVRQLLALRRARRRGRDHQGESWMVRRRRHRSSARPSSGCRAWSLRRLRGDCCTMAIPSRSLPSRRSRSLLRIDDRTNRVLLAMAERPRTSRSCTCACRTAASSASCARSRSAATLIATFE